MKPSTLAAAAVVVATEGYKHLKSSGVIDRGRALYEEVLKKGLVAEPDNNQPLAQVVVGDTKLIAHMILARLDGLRLDTPFFSPEKLSASERQALQSAIEAGLQPFLQAKS